MNEQPKSENNLVEELRALGQALGQSAKTLWESKERQQLEQELREGLQALGTEIDKAANTLKTSPKTHEVMGKVEQTLHNASASPAAQEVQEGLVSLLRKITQELNEWLAKAEADKPTPLLPAPDETTTDKPSNA